MAKRKVGDLEFFYEVVHRDVKYPRFEFESSDKFLIVLPLSVYDVDGILSKKEKWILEKLQILKGFKNEKYTEGMKEKSLIFGKFYEMTWVQGRYNIKMDNDCFEISTPTEDGKAVYLRNWLKKELRKKLDFYLEKFSEKLEIHYKKVYIRVQKTKWASCSSKGNLSFNLILVSLPDKLIEYVVLHEVIHLMESTHNRDFWNLVKKYIPDYKEREALLAEFWFLIRENTLWRDHAKFQP
jgi:predicted metal-dependent hydrolase